MWEDDGPVCISSQEVDKLAAAPDAPEEVKEALSLALEHANKLRVLVPKAKSKSKTTAGKPAKKKKQKPGKKAAAKKKDKPKAGAAAVPTASAVAQLPLEWQRTEAEEKAAQKSWTRRSPSGESIIEVNMAKMSFWIKKPDTVAQRNVTFGENIVEALAEAKRRAGWQG